MDVSARKRGGGGVRSFKLSLGESVSKGLTLAVKRDKLLYRISFTKVLSKIIKTK